MQNKFAYQDTSFADQALSQSANALVIALGKHFVAYYKGLADLTGSPKAALMLGHAMFMTRVVMEKQATRKGGKEGWFYKTATDWTKNTGLSVREIESARKLLVGLGILHERRQGMPAKLWFRVDLDKLAFLLCEFSNTAYRAWSWEDRVIKALLGKPILFYVPFAWMAKSALAGLYMSTLFARLLKSISHKEADEAGWFLSEITPALQQLNFGRHALMNAREKLIKAGMIEEVRESRAKSRLLTRINLSDLPAQIALEASKYNSLSESNKQGCRNPTFNSSPKRETTVHQNVKQEFTKAQNYTSPKRETCSAETTTLSYKEVNTTYHHLHTDITPKPAPKTGDVLEEVDFEFLIYPDNLLPAEIEEVKKLIGKAQYKHIRHQLVLDEWNGQMARGSVKFNRMGYLRTLAEKEANHILMIEVGHQIQARRLLRQQTMADRSKPKSDATTTTINTPEKQQERRMQMTNLRQSLGWK
ncbi:MAG: hypothetical protein HOP04_02240 [Methylophilaceae bacterium]|nr:hypothetical protein [Methylophilaceae bacterium]